MIVVGKPKVFIVILNWNGVEDTIECINSVKKISYPNYEIVIVDNASSGRDVETLKQKYGNSVHILENDRNYGYWKGLIIGMKFALEKSADYVLTLENDAVVKPNFLDRLVGVAEKHSEIGMLVPTVYSYERPHEIEEPAEKITRSGFRTVPVHKTPDAEWLDCDYVADACVLWKKSNIHRTNVMQAIRHYFIYGDFSLYLCVMRAGLKIGWVPDAIVWHKGSRSLKKLLSATRLYWFVKDNIIYRYRFLRDKYYLGLSTRQLVYVLMSFFLYQPFWHLSETVEALRAKIFNLNQKGMR